MDDHTPQNDQWTALVGLRTGRQRAVGLLLLGLALLCGLVALSRFPQAERISSAWLFYLGSIILFVATLYVLFAAQHKARVLDRAALVFGLVILGLAMIMRLYHWNSLPFGTWYDEADIGLQA